MKIFMETESPLEAEQMLRAPEAWAALWELTVSSGLTRELHKREHNFKTPGEALDWVQKSIAEITEDLPIEDMNRIDSGIP